MQLLLSSDQFQQEFLRLGGQYENYYWAMAWASAGSLPFGQLKINRSRIKKIVVGIHFYQTDPEFILEFMGHSQVRYILQPKGTFHPKLYLFGNGPTEWELLIGSGNFTKAAFNRNSEASLLISSEEDGVESIYHDSMQYISSHWLAARTMNQHDLEGYMVKWSSSKDALEGVTIESNIRTGTVAGFNAPVITRTWSDYMQLLNQENTLMMRLRILEIARQLFRSADSFSGITEEGKKFLGGVRNNLMGAGAENWPLFGDMSGNGIFAQQVANIDNPHISMALDCIPFKGEVTRGDYDNFCSNYQLAFTGTRLEGANNAGTASRLLLMKRPDVFVCSLGGNEKKLCQDFGTTQGITFERYWIDIVSKVRLSNWYRYPRSSNRLEDEIFEGRVALLDTLYYERKK